MNIDSISKIDSKEDFINFMKDLNNNLSMNPNEWQNMSLDDFLESICAWVSDYDFSKVEFSEKNNTNWSKIAMILYSGKIYE